MTSKTISELDSATLSDSLVMVVEGAAATEKVTVGNFKAYVNQNKQDKLTAGANITIENNVISATGGGSQITVDDELSTLSENPVQNKVITTALNNKVESSALSTVATSGSYNDLLNKPNLATVASTGNYNDLTNKPVIPSAQIQSDWNQSDDTALDYIKNKPNIPAGITVDQTYDATSTNAQSGTAVSEAISTKQDVLSAGTNINITGNVISAIDTKHYEIMPAATAQTINQIVQYVGQTDARYTSGYFYEGSSATTSETSVTFQPSSVAGTVCTCSPEDFRAWLDTIFALEPTEVASGTFGFYSGTPDTGNARYSIGLNDANGNSLKSISADVADLEAAGFTFTPYLSAQDGLTYTCSVGEWVTSYSWERINVQPSSGSSEVSWNDISNKPNFATVATSGDYSDLTNKPTIPAAQIQSDWDQNDNTALDYIKNKPTIPAGVIVDQTYNPSSTNAQSGVAVSEAIGAAISSTYKAAGSASSSNLPALTSTNEGKVYNMSDNFTTTSDFVEGAGKTYSAGTNIVIINTGSTQSPVYKYDVLSGFVDLSGYATTASLSTVATSGSYTDLTNKPSIPAAQIQSDWNQNDNTALDYIKNKPTIPSAITVDQTYDGTSTNAQSGVALENAKMLRNTATHAQALTVGGASSTQADSINIGRNSFAPGWLATSVGAGSKASDVAAGAFGYNAQAIAMNALAIGSDSTASAIGAIALGNKAKNSETKTLKVALTDTNGTVPAVDEASGLFTLLQADGTIPTGRYIAMTGADGTHAGTKGVVPAPAATDNTKFLRGDGTWAAVSSVTVDQTYDGTSANPQSGVAIAGAGFLTSHQDISGKQDVSNLVTSISAQSTDSQYPSAKCMYDMIGNIEAALAAI